MTLYMIVLRKDLHDDDKQPILQAYIDYLIKSGQVKIESEPDNAYDADE